MSRHSCVVSMLSGAFLSLLAVAAAAAPVVREFDPSGLARADGFSFGQGLRLADVLQREAQAQAELAALQPADGYQKQTEFDNTPYRFNMKPGEKLSADQFDAWMASRGIRIVPAKATPAETAATSVVAETVTK